MRAARWHGRRDVRVEDVPLPEPGPGEVLLDISWCGICGTDVEEYQVGPVVIPVGTPNGLTGRTAPVTIGHEFWGTVRQLGPDVTALPLGARVAVEICLACGECVFCRAGKRALCARWAAYGLHADGGLAEAVVVRADHCVPLPGAIDDRSAALIEPTEVAVRAVHKLSVQSGESAVVMGGGAIGLLSAQVLRAAGAADVVLVSGSAAAQRAAAELGYEAIDSASDWQGRVKARFQGEGPDLVVECQGRATSAHEAIRLARKGGRIVLVGLSPTEQGIDIMDMQIGEKTVIGSIQHERDADLRPAIALLASGAVRVGPIVTGEIPLERVVTDGLKALAAPDRRHIKLLVRTARA